MNLKFLTEASGSLTAAYLIKWIQEAGHLAVASDIDPKCMGRYLADEFIEMPSKNDPKLWEKIITAVREHKVDVVIPSFDETILGWAERKEELAEQGIQVVLSEKKTVEIFQDKWLTYKFFSGNGIPTPESSLEQKFPLIKPRIGRGAKGIKITSEPTDMQGMISQELIQGEEYSIDVFCDRSAKPVYIVPRKRIEVRDGKSTGGIVVNHSEITKWVLRICDAIPFQGPVNIQCFECEDGSVKFIEINTRVAGGMALAFAATENWFDLIVRNFIEKQPIEPKPVKFGMEMKRYYAEIFIPPDSMG